MLPLKHGKTKSWPIKVKSFPLWCKKNALISWISSKLILLNFFPLIVIHSSLQAAFKTYEMRGQLLLFVEFLLMRIYYMASLRNLYFMLSDRYWKDYCELSAPKMLLVNHLNIHICNYSCNLILKVHSKHQMAKKQ